MNGVTVRVQTIYSILTLGSMEHLWKVTFEQQQHRPPHKNH